MPFKVVVNSCYGGSSLSRKAVLLGRELSGDPEWCPQSIKGDRYDCGSKLTSDYGYFTIPRHDPILVKVVELLGKEASGTCAELTVQTIQSNMYYIDEYDGFESVVEPGEQDWILIDEELDDE